MVDFINTKNYWASAKAVLRGIFTVVNTYVEKNQENRLQIHNPTSIRKRKAN